MKTGQDVNKPRNVVWVREPEARCVRTGEKSAVFQPSEQVTGQEQVEVQSKKRYIWMHLVFCTLILQGFLKHSEMELLLQECLQYEIRERQSLINKADGKKRCNLGI